MSSFFAELKRRSIFKVGIAYAIVAWLLIEVASTILPTFHAPDWVLQTITFVIVLGFPLALIFAWAFELTPEGIKPAAAVDPTGKDSILSGRRLDFLIIALLAIAVIYLLVEKDSAPKPLTTIEEQKVVSANQEGIAPTSDIPEQSVAVLPFVNMSSDPEQEYFSDGISEELLNQLTKIRGLFVPGRTSSFYFKGRNEDFQTIGKKLGVAHVLEGSVRKAGNRVRITAQLIKVSDGYHMWSESYDRELDDIFSIQEEIAQSIADALSVTLGIGTRDFNKGGTRNFEAYDAFLASISPTYYFSGGGTEEHLQRISLLEKAATLDPNYADPWSALTFRYEALSISDSPGAEEFMNKRDQAAARAFALAPKASSTLYAKALVDKNHGNWAAAEKELQKAVELAPTAWYTNFEYGSFLHEVGHISESIEYLHRAKRIEPLSPDSYVKLAVAYGYREDFGSALQQLKQAKDLAGFAGMSHELLYLAMAMKDRKLINKVIIEVINEEAVPEDIRALARNMAPLLDSPDKARTELHHWYMDHDDTNVISRSRITPWASYFGEHELALRAFKIPGKAKSWISLEIWRPNNKKMRQLPGFKGLVKELGLVDYWHTTGNWGDFCHPVGDDDFECE